MRDILNLDDLELPVFPEKHKHLYHYLPGFLGCFALNMRDNVNWEELKQWKDNPKKEITKKMAIDFLPYIQQKYDIITTAPASTERNINYYCANELTIEIGKLTKIPFVQCFEQRKNKSYHGRFASLKQETPVLTKNGQKIKNMVILWIDDYINTGMTARNCFNVLKKNNNHIDGLVWVRH